MTTSPGARRGGPVAFHFGCTNRPVPSVRSVPGRRFAGEAERARDVLALPLPLFGLSFLARLPLGLALRLGFEGAAPSPPSLPASPPSGALAFFSFFSWVCPYGDGRPTMGFGGPPSSPVCDELGDGRSPVAFSPLRSGLSDRPLLSCRSRGVVLSGRFLGLGGGDAFSISAQSACASDMYGSLTQALAPATSMALTLRTDAILTEAAHAGRALLEGDRCLQATAMCERLDRCERRRTRFRVHRSRQGPVP